MKTAFVTDSGTGESMEVLSRDGIYSLPLQISCGEESYQDSVDITIDQVYEIDKDVYLSNGNKGYVFFHRDVERTKFNETRDYHYPIPINERSLNPNLTQNPGWNDGLDF